MHGTNRKKAKEVFMVPGSNP